MNPLSKKSNRCGLIGAIALHLLILVAGFIPRSMAEDIPLEHPYESIQIKLAEASVPIQQELEPEPAKEEVQPEELTPPEPKLTEDVNLEQPKQEEPKPVKPRKKPKPKVQQEVAKQIENAQPVAAPAPPKVDEDKAAAQSAASVLLARLEKEKRYPNSARRLGLEGSLILRVELDNSGNIRSYRVEGDAHHILQSAAAQAMERVRQKWKPIPVQKNMSLRVPLRFVLR